MNAFCALSKVDQFLYSQCLENVSFRKLNSNKPSVSISHVAFPLMRWRDTLVLKVQERDSRQELLLLIGPNQDGTLSCSWIGENQRIFRRQNCRELGTLMTENIEKLFSELLENQHCNYALVGKNDRSSS